MVPLHNISEESILTESQKRSLSSSLRLLEERLLMLELMAKYGDHEGTLFQLDFDLEEVQKIRLFQFISDIRSKIELLHARLNLSARVVPFSRLLYSMESYFWSVFCDQKSDKLKRYGKVSGDLPKVLDPVIDQINNSLREIVKMIGSKSNDKIR